MLSLGSVAFTPEGKELGSFHMNLKTLEGAQGEPDTMRWWQTQPMAWEACREDPREPDWVMKAYVQWVKSLPGKPVFVAYPAGFDFLFVYHYLIRFTGTSPFSFAALDVKTYAMAKLGLPFRETTKRNMPKEWFSKDVKHTHVALDDAREQGRLFIAMLHWKPEHAQSTSSKT